MRLRKWMAWNTTSGHEARASNRPQGRLARRASSRWSSLTLREIVARRRYRRRGSHAISDHPWVCQSTGNHAGRDTTLRSRAALRESGNRRMRLDGLDAATTVTVVPDQSRAVESAVASAAVSPVRSHRPCHSTSEVPASGDAEGAMTEVLRGERKARKRGY